MAATTYVVKSGDNLTKIARAHGTTISNLVKWNDITDANYIVVGQTLVVSGGSASSSSKKASNRPIIKAFGLQSDTTRTVYATWTWSKDHTEHYKVKWTYYTGDGVAFIGQETTVTAKQSMYTAPENAISVAFYAKPISKTRTVNKKETSYWTADWSTVERYYFSKNPPSTPAVPSVDIHDYTLTAELDNLDVNASSIQFQIVKDDTRVFKTGTASIKTRHASYSCTVDAGSEYKVRARAVRGEMYSDWSDYSQNVETIPAPSEGIVSIKALSSTSVQLDWSDVKNATGYEVQYTTQKRYFDSSNEVQSQNVPSVVGFAIITGLETGTEYFFRVRSTNDKGNSAWTEIVSIKLGTAPSPPTTWSSSTTVTTGSPVTLYWVHNSEDGSSQTYAYLELEINGEKTEQLIPNSTDEFEKDKTSSYVIDTSGYTEGTKILWRVKTKGTIDTYSDWSIQRTVDVYAPPALEMEVVDSNGETFDTLTSFPFYVLAAAGPASQTPIGYYISITSNETYETTDQRGNNIVVKAGQAVYSRHFDIEDLSTYIMLSASDVDFENNISYTVNVTVSMDSGLTAESSIDFTVGWTEVAYLPNAEISYDPNTFTTSIRAYCADEDDRLVNGVTLSVYRREYDGTFVELATGLDNMSNTFITDPHPALDYARYRVVAMTNDTGAISYYDVPGYPIEEKAVIIQWDEDWTSFETTSESALEKPYWSGSLLRLPYNIDVSDTHAKDTALVEYIGREHPVAYYGTQLGVTSTWNVAIDKADKETLYAVRRLARWMGNVYVREPSGSGYWAKIDVSFSQRHTDLTIPITFDISRVSGGA